MTTIWVLAGSWVATIVGIISVGWLLDAGMNANPQLKRRLGRWLMQNVAKEPEAWLQSANLTFVQGFDKIYGGNSSYLQRTIWLGLVMSPITLAFVRTGFVNVDAKPEEWLILAMLGAFGYAGFGLATLGAGTVGAAIGARIGGNPNDIGAILFRFTFSLVGAIILGGIFGGIIGGILGGVIGGTGSVIIGVILGFGVGFGVIVAIIEDWKIPIHPLKAIFWSIVFVFIFGLVASDAGKAFIREIFADPKVLSFVAFNFFADGVSLWETRWVLMRGAAASVKLLVSLVVLDFVASGLLYLILPTILWPQIFEFWDAVRFQGERPWLGILFWTTFSTSFLFYLFVVAALLVRPLTAGLSLFGWLSQPFRLEANPVRCLAVTTAVVVTVGFFVAGIAQAV